MVTAAEGEGMAPARWWKQDPDGRLFCYLCPRYCRMSEGQAGFCFIRKNVGGRLYSLAYEQPCGLQIDPVEKKPLFHFMPGSSILSLGTAGCNMGCKFCQNWEISKSREDQVRSTRLSSEEVVDLASDRGCPAVAFTYNEPTIWGEYVVDIAGEARRRGVRTVMVTNGYATAEVIPELYADIDAANVDLKAFTEEFYRKITLTQLAPVLEVLRDIHARGVWIEVTTLIIPTLNDGLDEIRQIAGWVRRNLGAEVPLHLTAFHPDFKLQHLPSTTHETLHEARQVAMEQGLHYVYEGNVHCDTGGTTYCPRCGEPVIERSWHAITANRLKNGICSCGERIAGCFPPC